MPKASLFNIIFLPIILSVGFVTSYEDFKGSKIRNKWILFGLSYSFLMYLFAWILYILGDIKTYLLWNFDRWCINLGISILVAYSLWHFKMWAAGDAKLFICYSSLIPMGQYSRVYFNYYFASFFLLLAIFIPATAFLFLRSIIYFIKRFNFGRVREISMKLTKFNKIEAGKVLFGFFTLFLFFRILREELMNLLSKILPNQNILILVSLLAFRPLSRFFKKQTKSLIVASFVLIMYLGIKLLFSWKQIILEMVNTLGRSLSVMIFFPIFEKIVDLYSEKTAQKTTPFAIWMFLGALIVWFL